MIVKSLLVTGYTKVGYPKSNAIFYKNIWRKTLRWNPYSYPHIAHILNQSSKSHISKSYIFLIKQMRKNKRLLIIINKNQV